MQGESLQGAVLKFHDATFAPGSNVIKAQERQTWIALENLRIEAEQRVQQEVRASTAAVCEALQRRSEELLAERTAQLAEVFAKAALELERTALDLAIQIAEKIVDSADPQAFFARAAEHLQALVPVGGALRVRIHPSAEGPLAACAQRLQAAGVQHLGVVVDPSLPEPRSLLVETSDGEIDLGCSSQLQRVVKEVMAARTAYETASANVEQGAQQ